MDVVPFQQNAGEPAVMAANAGTPLAAGGGAPGTSGNAAGGSTLRDGGRPRSRRPWTKSLTGSMTVVCFIFGGLLAMQLRAYQNVQNKREETQRGQIQAEKQLEELRKSLQGTNQQNAALSTALENMKKQVESGQAVGRTQLEQLNTQIKDLQMAAAMTPMYGPGLTVTMSDNPEVSKVGVATGMPLPGIVHDFDLQQVVNEMRAAGAEAISINGTRITGFTPIRCVGPVIDINAKQVGSPYRVEAIGDPATLYGALNMPSGIVENLRNQVIVIHLSKDDMLHLPAADSMPKFRYGKTGA